MQRRQFLKFLGKAALVAPAFLVVAPIATISAQELVERKPLDLGPINLRPLSEGGVLPELAIVAPIERPKPLSLTLTSIVPQWSVQLPNQPSRVDPFGDWGYVAIKYTINNVSYGDWLKIANMWPNANYPAIVQAAQWELYRYSCDKIARINPTYTLAPIMYWTEAFEGDQYENYPTYDTYSV